MSRKTIKKPSQMLSLSLSRKINNNDNDNNKKDNNNNNNNFANVLNESSLINVVSELLLFSFFIETLSISGLRIFKNL